MAEKRPYRTQRTGTEHYTIPDAHPSHRPMGKVDHKGAGKYEIVYDQHCVPCRGEKDAEERCPP